MPYLLLACAIVAEVVATTALKASPGFTRIGPALVVVLGYGVAFYLLSLSLRDLSLGFAYAVWCGFGIVLVTLVGIVLYGERLDLAGGIGIAMIIAGIAVLLLFSRTSGY